MTVWGWLALVSILIGMVVAFEGAPPEGIGAPTNMTVVGIAIMVLGVGLAVWRFLVNYGARISH